MRQVVFDRSDGELALHVEGGTEEPLGEETSVDTTHFERSDFDEESRSTRATEHAWISLELPGARIASQDFDTCRRVDRFRHIGRAVHGLAIVAMTVELDDRLPRQLELHGTAPAFDDDHSLRRSHDWIPYAPVNAERANSFNARADLSVANTSD